mmetsp:Transcript_16787/g.47798  ORF Transcript_16787/g.47798 Transcript_16787/m.47798 type:complete len:136 (-) Transcript_16787:1167-1574(-)
MNDKDNDRRLTDRRLTDRPHPTHTCLLMAGGGEGRKEATRGRHSLATHLRRAASKQTKQDKTDKTASRQTIEDAPHTPTPRPNTQSPHQLDDLPADDAGKGRGGTLSACDKPADDAEGGGGGDWDDGRGLSGHRS